MQTSDTALAAYLISTDYMLSLIDYSQPRYLFVFPDNDGIDQAVNAFITSKALVDPATYNRIIRKLTRTLHRQLQWGKE